MPFAPRSSRAIAGPAPTAVAARAPAPRAPISNQAQALRLGQPGDSYEQEADRVAAQVLRGAPPPAIHGAAPAAQRKCAACAQEEERIQAKGDAPVATPALAGQLARLRQHGGQPLSPAQRAFFEPRFGRAFRQVRIHADSAAHESARTARALAYTAGSDIVFAPGQFAPESEAGRHLLAHELTHVVQQAGGQAAPGIQRLGDPALAPSTMDCRIPDSTESGTVTDILFGVNSSTLSPTALFDIGNFLMNWNAAGASAPVRVDGFASVDGTQETNWQLSCERAQAVTAELQRPADGVPDSLLTNPPFASGETDQFGASGAANRRATITADFSYVPPDPERPEPEPEGPTPGAGCSAVPTSTPGSCAGRNQAYCDSRGCYPGNPWLDCVCVASGQVCEAVEAFLFGGVNGALLETCVELEHASHPVAIPFVKKDINDKGEWFRQVNRCIWEHWRLAVDALHNPAMPIPSGVTADWRTAITTCRTSGAGSTACCHAQVEAEQRAIDLCSPYDSVRFGPLPTDVPSTPGCSSVVARFAPPPPFTGDFGNVNDRITYGKMRCCP